MIYILEIRFILLDKKIKLILSIPIKYWTESIRENKIYIALNISTCNVKSLFINI